MFFSVHSETPSPRRTSKLVPFAEAALFIAMGFVLSFFKIDLASGGSFTVLSMLPVLLIGYRRGPALGILSGVVYSLLQMLQQFWAPPVPNFISFVAVIMLDYVIAFGVLGLSGLFRSKPESNVKYDYRFLFAIALCLVLRFLCHYLSGIIIWGSGDAEIPAWLWSLTYNGSYMLWELITCLIAGGVLAGTGILRYGLKQPE